MTFFNFDFFSEDFSLSLESDHLVWRKEGGKARMRIAEISLQPASLPNVQVKPDHKVHIHKY